MGVFIGLANIKIDPFTKSCFFYLFIFAIGYKVGPQFFQGLRGKGLQQAALSVIFCLLALGSVWAIAVILGYDKGLAAGLMAGAVTESATIGSASDAINQLNISPEVKARCREPSGGGLLRDVPVWLGGRDVVPLADGAQSAPHRSAGRLQAKGTRTFRRQGSARGRRQCGVRSSSLREPIESAGTASPGRAVAEFERNAWWLSCRSSAFAGREQFIDAEPEAVIADGDVLALVGRRETVMCAKKLIGEEVADMELLHFPLQTLDIVVTNKELGRTGRLMNSRERKARGVRLKKLIRLGQRSHSFLETRVNRGDTLQVIGAPRNVQRVAKEAGYIERPTPDADLTWLAAGIVLGVLHRHSRADVQGRGNRAAAPAVASCHGVDPRLPPAIYPVFGKLPAAAGWLLETLGLNTFIAIVGLGAGLSFISGIKSFGIPLLVSGVFAVLIPHTLTLLIGRRFFPSINRGVLVGVCCGAGTNTPALLATQEAAQSKIPVLGYAVPYAIGNVLIIAWGPVIVNLIPKLP